MGFIEEDNFRDDKGRLLPGHGGLKKPGSNNRLPGEIKEKLTKFLSGEIENIESIYSEVSAKDKLRFLSELLAYVLPKSKELKIEDASGSRTAQIDFTKLSPGALKEVLSLTEIENHE